MIIRDGFVTNSSSTNFMIISKKELTYDYLLKKLGFKKTSSIINSCDSLISDIMSGIRSGVRWFDIDTIDYNAIFNVFGKESADKYKELSQKGYHTYIGHINTDDDYLTALMKKIFIWMERIVFGK